MPTNHTHKIYRPLFREAASLVWRHKILLLPGLFVSFFINLGIYELMLGDADRLLPKFNWNFIFPIISLQGLMARLNALSLTRTISIFATAGAVVFGLLFVSAWAFALMIIVIKKAAKNQEIKFVEIAKQAATFTWPILFVALLAKSITYVSLNIVSMPTVHLIAQPNALNAALYYAAFIIFVALSLLMNVLMYYTIMFLVIDKNPLLLAIEKAFMLFVRHWVVTLEFSLLLFLINLLAIVGFGFFISLLSLPLVIFLLISTLVKSNIILLISVIVFTVTLLVGLIFATAYLVAFYITGWTLLFLKLDDGVRSKLHRLFHPFAFLHRKLFS